METEPVPLNLKYQLASMSGIVRAQVTPRSAGGDAGAGGGQASGVTDLKGMLLTKVQVQLIFWGTNWGQAAPSTGTPEDKRSEENTSELQSHFNLVFLLLL